MIVVVGIIVFQINTLGFIIIVSTLVVAMVVLMFSYKVIFGAETNNTTTAAVSTVIPQYVKEIKFQTCHAMFDIYNLSSYYKCVGM